ncbi:MAG: DNA-binding protein WhiA [Ruminococcaceae bacterium]|nr:DNA-binding protein WhiA [Oscillospiraceae bacterium]
MSFANEVKQQLCRAEVKSSSAALYELLGLSSGKKFYSERQTFLEKKAGGTLVELFKPEHLENDISEDETKGFIRGCFIATGTVNNPSKSSHLEIRFTDSMLGVFCREQMIMAGFAPNVSFRREYMVLYIKKTELIVDLLTYLGAYKAVLDFDNAVVAKELNVSVQRAVNCDLANIDKASSVGKKQIEAIHKLKKSGRFNALPENVKEIAELRLRNPESSLTELGKLLDPPISKSGAAHRMKQIMDVSDKL